MHRFMKALFVSALMTGGSELSAAPIGVGDFLASDTLINFDGLVGGASLGTGELVTNQFAGQGVTFSNTFGGSHAQANLGALAANNSNPNIVWSDQGGGSTVGQYVQLNFAPDVNRVGMWFFLSRSATFTLEIYGTGGSLLESLTQNGTTEPTFDEGFAGLSSGTDIAFARIFSTSTGGESFNFSIDDLRFGGDNVGVIPIPAPALLLITALAGLSIARRRHV